MGLKKDKVSVENPVNTLDLGKGPKDCDRNCEDCNSSLC